MRHVVLKENLDLGALWVWGDQDFDDDNSNSSISPFIDDAVILKKFLLLFQPTNDNRRDGPTGTGIYI